MMNGFKLDQMPSVKRSNILKCITYYNRKRLHSKLGYINPMLIMSNVHEIT
jgi:hypothetical protein